MTQTQKVRPLRRLDLIRPDPGSNPITEMQPYLGIVTNDGSMYIGFRRQFEDAVSMDVWHGIVKRLPIPADADGEKLTSAINGGGINTLVARIVAGSEVVWDGSNHVGSQNEDAESALEELREWLMAQGGEVAGGLYGAGDWLETCTAQDLGITAETSNDEVNAIAERLESEARDHDVVMYGTECHLEAMRQELLDAQEETDEQSR